PFAFAIVTVRYVELGRSRVLARPGTHFALRVLTDAPCVAWRLHGGHGEVCHHTLHLRAPGKPGVYRLYVEAAGHAAKALVVVAGAAIALAWELFGEAETPIPAKPEPPSDRHRERRLGPRSRELGPLAWPLALFVGWTGLTFLWTLDRTEGAKYLLFYVLPF